MSMSLRSARAELCLLALLCAAARALPGETPVQESCAEEADEASCLMLPPPGTRAALAEPARTETVRTEGFQDSPRIPRLIHMAWVPITPSQTMPEEFMKNVQMWKKLNHGWIFSLWDEEANRRVVQEHYPWFLTTYDGMDRTIKRLDAMRYIYMHMFGGVYTDMDVTASKPIEPFLENNDIFLTKFGHALNNYFLASAPGQRFWLEALRRVEAIASLHKNASATTDWFEDVVCVAGWAMLTTLWTNHFHGQLNGSGVSEDAKYIVYNETQFQNDLGLHHGFSGSWTSFVQAVPEVNPWTACEAMYPGWGNVMQQH